MVNDIPNSYRTRTTFNLLIGFLTNNHDQLLQHFISMWSSLWPKHFLKVTGGFNVELPQPELQTKLTIEPQLFSNSCLLSHCSNHFPSRHFLVQSQQWKQKKNVWNIFNVNNKGTWTTSLFHYIYYISYISLLTLKKEMLAASQQYHKNNTNNKLIFILIHGNSLRLQ